jgi:hypothetical protein
MGMNDKKLTYIMSHMTVLLLLRQQLLKYAGVRHELIKGD